PGEVRGRAEEGRSALDAGVRGSGDERGAGETVQRARGSNLVPDRRRGQDRGQDGGPRATATANYQADGEVMPTSRRNCLLFSLLTMVPAALAQTPTPTQSAQDEKREKA